MRISDWSSDVCSSDLCRRRFGAEVTADRDEASRIRGRQREHALRFGARIEPARNPLPLHRAIAKEMQDRATAAGGHGQHRARARDAGTAARECRLAFPCPWAIGKQPPAAAAIVSGMVLDSPCLRIAKQPAATDFAHHSFTDNPYNPRTGQTSEHHANT